MAEFQEFEIVYTGVAHVVSKMYMTAHNKEEALERARAFLRDDPELLTWEVIDAPDDVRVEDVNRLAHR